MSSFARKADWLLGFLLMGLLVGGYQEAVLAFPGVRALGMGGAYTAVADDAGAVFWNPAGLMQINGQSVAGALTLYPGEADDYETFAAYLAQDSGYGAGALSWYYGRLEPVASPSGLSYTQVHDFCYSLAKPAAKRVSWGGNIRYHRERQPFSTSWQSSWTGDLAALAELSDSLRLGITFRDIYAAVKGGADDGAGNLLVGLAFQPEKGVVFAVDGYDVLNRLQSRAVRVGAEFKLAGGVALRAGLQKATETDWKAWTWGAGVDLADWRVEYAYLSGDYEGIHTMGIAWHF